MNELTADRSLDARGLYCPEPVYRTRLEIEDMPVGHVLEVLADDPAAEDDIKVWTNRAGQSLLTLEKNGYDFRFLIKKIVEKKSKVLSR